MFKAKRKTWNAAGADHRIWQYDRASQHRNRSEDILRQHQQKLALWHHSLLANQLLKNCGTHNLET